MAEVIDYFERMRRGEYVKYGSYGQYWTEEELREAGGSVPAARLAIWRGLLYGRHMGEIYGNDIEAMFAAERDRK